MNKKTKITRVLYVIMGILTTFLGVAMMILAFIYFDKGDETYIIQLASLYVALFISAIITAIGVAYVIPSKKENKE